MTEVSEKEVFKEKLHALAELSLCEVLIEIGVIERYCDEHRTAIWKYNHWSFQHMCVSIATPPPPMSIPQAVNIVRSTFKEIS